MVKENKMLLFNKWVILMNKKEELLQIDKKIDKLNTFLKDRDYKDAEFLDYLDEGLGFVPNDLPALLYPATFARDFYDDCITDSDNTLKKVAKFALVSPVTIPCYTLAIVLAAPFAIPAIAIETTLGAIQSTHAMAYNARTKKAAKKLKSLEAKKASLINGKNK